MSLQELFDDEPTLAVGVAPPPGGSPPECFIIPWRGVDEWNFLLECMRYVKDNPSDLSSRLIYRNLLRAYAFSTRH